MITSQNLALVVSYSLSFKAPFFHTVSGKIEMSSFAGSSCIIKNPKHQSENKYQKPLKTGKKKETQVENSGPRNDMHLFPFRLHTPERVLKKTAIPKCQ